MPNPHPNAWNRLMACALCACGAAWLWGTGCGGHGPSARDAGADGATAADSSTDGSATDAGIVLPFEVAQPNIPWLEDGEPEIAHPVLTPCPDGWYETELAGETICEPWPAGSYPDCPAGEAQLIGDDGCPPLGSPCPAGEFPEDLPADRPVVYVREGATTVGDGSRTAPYRTLAEALASSPPTGSVLALGRGHYEGSSMPPGLTLFGVCPAETVLTAPPGAPVALETEDGTLEVHRLRVEPGDATALRAIGPGAVLTLRAVEVRNALCRGIDAMDEATVDAEELVIRGTRACTDPTSLSTGIRAAGARLQVRRSLLAHNTRHALQLEVLPGHDTAAELVLEDSIVRGQGAVDHAIRAEHDGDTTAPVSVVVRRTLFEGNEAGGVRLAGERTVGEVDQVLARDNGSPRAIIPWVSAQPLAVFDGAAVEVRRSAFTTNLSFLRGGPLLLVRAGASTVEDVVIADNKGTGLRAEQSEAPLSVRRVTIEANSAGDVVMSDASLELEDARLGANPLAQDEDPTVYPAAVVVFAAQGTAHLDLARARIDRAVGGSVIVMHAPDASPAAAASGVLEDIVIRDTRPLGGAGWGMIAFLGADLTARRALLARNHMSSVELGPGAGRLRLEDTVIRDTRAYPREEVGGRGIVLGAGTEAEVRRVFIEGTHEFGVLTFESAVTLEDVEVHHTKVAACAERGACLPYGHALGAYTRSTLSARRFVLADAAFCGLHFARDTQVDLFDGLVTRTEIGACLQVDGYDAARLSNQVFYVDNGRNLDATELPVPDPGS